MTKAAHLNIKNGDAHKLATELAGLTGESLTSAVTQAASAWHASVGVGAPTSLRLDC
jgi:hypothetical protein